MGADAGHRPGLVHHDAAMGPAHRLAHHRVVQRPQRPEVHHLRVDPFGGQDVGRLERDPHGFGETHHGDVAPGAPHHALAEGHKVLPVGHLAGPGVHQLRLQEDHRVVVPDRAFEEPLGVVRGGRGRHLQPRHVGEEALQRLRVLGRQVLGRAVGPAEHDGHGNLAARHVEHLGGVVDHLVDGHQGEIEGHELDDGPQPRHGRPHAETGESFLGDGRVHHPPGAERVPQPLADLVSAVVLGHFLAD